MTVGESPRIAIMPAQMLNRQGIAHHAVVEHFIEGDTQGAQSD